MTKLALTDPNWP